MTTTLLTLGGLNGLPPAEAADVLGNCCRSPVWSVKLAALRPFPDVEALLATGDDLLTALDDADLAAALARYAPIGQPPPGGSHADRWSRGEEAGIDQRDTALMAALRTGAQQYRERFGYPYLIAAQGLTGPEILADLQKCLDHDPADELRRSRTELRSICATRLTRLIAGP